MFKKIVSVFVVGILFLSLTGCRSASPLEPFDQFIHHLEKRMLQDTTSFNMNFILNDPSALDIPQATVYGLGFQTEQQAQVTYDQYAKEQKQLHAYDYAKLNDTQKRTYDALDNYLSRQLVLKDYYYYDNPVIGSYSSTIQDLPLLLEMYAFNSVTDIEDFYRNIAQFKDDFLKYAELENKRQALGLGYSKEILEDTKKQIQAIINGKGEDLISKLNQIFNNLSFLTKDEKAAYQLRNQEVIENDFIGAYQSLLEALEKIEGQNETLGLYYQKNGKKYYEAMIYHQLGIQEDICEIEENLERAFNEQLLSLQAFVFTHQELLEINDPSNITYQVFSTPQEGLDYLKTQIFSIVPKIDDLTYQIYNVPENLQAGFAPAAYLTRRIDASMNQAECIMINPSASENMLPTLVHEGYPGHMYQNSYFFSLDYPLLNKMLDCIGYTEGWAVYVENMSDYFLLDETEAATQKLLIKNNQISSTLLALMDIGIHAHGWKLSDCTTFFENKLHTKISDTQLQPLYNIIVQTPGYYLYYIYSGQILTELAQHAKKELGAAFDLLTFHQAILDSGPVGLDIVRKNVDLYISQQQSN